MTSPLRAVFDPQTVVGDISQLQQVVGITSNSGLQQAISDVSGRVQLNEQAIEVIDASLGIHYQLVTGNQSAISDLSTNVSNLANNFQEDIKKLNEPQLLLRKQVYQRSGFVDGQTLVLENLNTYISDYTNQRPFIGKITGSIYTTQRYSIGGFTADVCYLGGINRMVPRVEYANITTWDNKKFGLSSISLESEVPPTGNDVGFPIDPNAYAPRPNGTLTVEIKGDTTGNRLNFNVYTDIFIQIDTLLELQDLPIINDEDYENNNLSEETEDNKLRKAIVEEYVAPSLIHQTETVPEFPLEFLSESVANNHTVTLYARYKIDYLKNKVLKNQFFKFLDPEDWKLDQDIFVYQIITEQAVYYVSTYNGYNKEDKNMILSTFEDTYHNQGSGPYDRVITPYFSSGPAGNAMPTSIIPALVGAQTGLMVIAQETFYCSGPPEKQLVFENSVIASYDWLPQRLSQFGLKDKNIHMLTGSAHTCWYINLIPKLKANGLNVVNIICTGSCYWCASKEIQEKTYLKQSGYDSEGQYIGGWSPATGTGAGLWYIAEDAPNTTLKEYLDIGSPAIILHALVYPLAIGLPDGMLSEDTIAILKTLYATSEYNGASFTVWYGLLSGFTFLPGVDMSLIFSQTWLDSLGVASWEDVRVLDYYGEAIKAKFPIATQELKQIGYYGTVTAKVGGIVDGVSYGQELTDAIENYTTLFKTAKIVYPPNHQYTQPNYYASQPRGYNPVMLMFVQEVLGLGL